MNVKAVQVIVVPAHEQLDDPVQVRDRQAVRKLDPPPNRGMNVPQQQLQPQQQRRAHFDHRPTLNHYAELCPRFVMGSNKGEARNSLARAIFIHRLGEIRDRTYENQQHRASGLNLLVTAIILWNTRYLERAVAELRQVEEIPDHLLAHLSPLGWEHVNLTGDYIWDATRNVSENTDGLRPLRAIPEPMRKAA
jgi:hypothetical protein